MRRTLPRGLRACSVPAMDLDLVGRRAAVMASSDGIGKAIACALAREGVHVMMSGRDADKLAGGRRGGARPLAGHGAQVAGVQHRSRHAATGPARSSRPPSPRSAASTSCVTNTGGPPGGPAALASTTRPGSAPSSRCCSRSPAARAPRCRTSRPPSRGASSRSRPPRSRPRCPALGFSNVFRPGIHGLVKTLAEELGPKGITVNLIAPGKIDTARVRWLDDTRAERTRLDRRRGARGLRARHPARPLRRARSSWPRSRSSSARRPARYVSGTAHAGRRRPRARALAGVQRGLVLLLTGELLTTSSALAVQTALGWEGYAAQRRSARARPDRPGRVRAGAALRAARRARRRPPRPALRDGLRPRRDRARDGGHRARHGLGRRAASGRSTRWRSSSASASRYASPAYGPMLAAAVTTEELPRVMAMNASVWQFGTIAGPIAAGLLHLARLARAVRRRGARGRPRRRHACSSCRL